MCYWLPTPSDNVQIIYTAVFFSDYVYLKQSDSLVNGKKMILEKKPDETHQI